jgi:hypothetical protein
MDELLTRDEAIVEFRKLVAEYGLHWGANVPRAAYYRMAAVNKLLTERDRREALGVRCI